MKLEYIKVKSGRLLILSSVLLAAQPAVAGEFKTKPIAESTDVVRYHKGEATISRETDSSLITVVPIEPDRGRLAFIILYRNKLEAPINFGLENVSATAGTTSIVLMTKDRLESQAKSRAGWSMFGAALVAGLANVDYSSTTVRTPYGKYTASSSYSNNWAAHQQTREAAADINADLSSRLEHISEAIIDTTTVDPHTEYGGKIILDKFKAKFPTTVTVNVNGQPFNFQVTK